MTDDLLSRAIARLDQALALLERRLPDPAAGVPQASYDRLERRHETLRARTSATVDRLDRLLDAAPSPLPPADATPPRAIGEG